MAELDFISKYTGLQIEEILDYAYRNQYKVSLDIVAEPKTLLLPALFTMMVEHLM